MSGNVKGKLLAEKVAQILKSPMIPIEASGRHVHLSQRAVDTLFGKNYELTRKSDLSQPGQYLCRERVTIVGPKRELQNIAVLGPVREACQVEISRSDGLLLGIEAPLRMSGDLADSGKGMLVGPAGQYRLETGVIVAKRHIHMTPIDAGVFKISDGQIVSVQIPGERGLLMHNVVVRVSDQFATSMHIDYDEANACGFQNGYYGRILNE